MKTVHINNFTVVQHSEYVTVDNIVFTTLSAALAFIIECDHNVHALDDERSDNVHAVTTQ